MISASTALFSFLASFLLIPNPPFFLSSSSSYLDSILPLFRLLPFLLLLLLQLSVFLLFSVSDSSSQSVPLSFHFLISTSSALFSLLA